MPWAPGTGYDADVRWWLPCLLVSTGCFSQRTVQIDLPIEEDQPSLLLAVEAREQVELYAYDLRGGPPGVQTLLPSYVGAFPVRLTALFYEQPLDRLALEPGPILPATNAPARFLSAASSTLTAVIRGAEIESWAPVSELSPELRRFPIPTLPEEECVELGGCFVDDSEACQLPCPRASTPTEPNPLELLPPRCPAGWSAVELSEGVVACDPWPEGRSDCPGYQTRFPGDDGCHVLTDCPAGTWPENAPPGPRVYVSKQAAAGGDGSQGAPFNTLAAGVSAAAEGAVILLAAGTYGGVAIDKSLSITGVCPSMTFIGDSGAGMDVDAGTVLITDLTIVSPGYGIEVARPARLEMSRVFVEDSNNSGIQASGTVVLNDVVVRRTNAFGLSVPARGSLTGTRVRVDHPSDGGILANESDLSLTDAVIHDTAQKDDGTFGRGANIQNGATARLTRTVFEDNHDVGLFVSTASATIEQVVVRGTKSRSSDDGAGFGLLIQSASTLDARDCWFDGNRESNMYVLSTGTIASLDRSVISNAHFADDGAGGYGVQVLGNGSAVLHQTAVIDSGLTGINISDSPRTSLYDVLIRNTGIDPGTQKSGKGLYVHGEAELLASGLRVEATAARGVDLEGELVRADLRDVHVERTGLGDCYYCSGICADEGASLHLERAVVTDARGAALAGIDVTTELAGQDLQLFDAVPTEDCVRNDPQKNGGRGLGIYCADGATCEITRFLVQGSIDSGVMVAQYIPLAENTSLDLTDGLVSENGIGASILVEGYDLRRLTNRVTYVDNGSNLNYDVR